MSQYGRPAPYSDWPITSSYESHAKNDDYIIEKSGSNYDVVNGSTGKIAQTKTGLVAAIQWAHDTGGNGTSIGVKGTMLEKEWEQKLTISNGGVTLHGTSILMGTGGNAGYCFMAKDGLNDDMILITGVKCHLYNMTLDGNYNNQTAGSGIVDNAGGSSDFHFENIYCIRMKEHGFYWVDGGAGVGVALYSEYNKGNGFYMKGSRNVLLRCGAYSNEGYGHFIEDVVWKPAHLIGRTAASNYLSGFCVKNSRLQQLIGLDSHLNRQHGVLLYGAHECTINGGSIYNNSQETNNTYDGMHLMSLGTTHSVRNQILALQINTWETKKQRYGIRENDANQDFNKIGFCTAISNVTDQISLQGGNSEKAYCVEA